jgi:hypothetical protein
MPGEISAVSEPHPQLVLRNIPVAVVTYGDAMNSSQLICLGAVVVAIVGGLIIMSTTQQKSPQQRLRGRGNGNSSLGYLPFVTSDGGTQYDSGSSCDSGDSAGWGGWGGDSGSAGDCGYSGGDSGGGGGDSGCS